MGQKPRTPKAPATPINAELVQHIERVQKELIELLVDLQVAPVDSPNYRRAVMVSKLQQVSNCVASTRRDLRDRELIAKEAGLL